MDLKAVIREVPNFPKPGILFFDITTILQHPKEFNYVIETLHDRYKNSNITSIGAIESRGFIFGAPLAVRLGVPFFPFRKPGKLPYQTVSESYSLEYGSDAVHMHIDAVNKGDHVVIIDDLIATGGTLKAAANLVEKQGGIVHECACVVELDFLPGRKTIGSTPLFTMVHYQSEAM